MQTASTVVRAIALFVLAGVCEIGGGWLMWKWQRDHWHGRWGGLGVVMLILYGIIPTFQASHFGRRLSDRPLLAPSASAGAPTAFPELATDRPYHQPTDESRP